MLAFLDVTVSDDEEADEDFDVYKASKLHFVFITWGNTQYNSLILYAL